MDIQKATEPITKVLNSFLKPFDCVAEFGTDFAYYPGSNTITYSLIITEENAEDFLRDVEKRFPSVHADVFIWSFLHEIGHHETDDDFEDEEHEEYMKVISSGSLTNEEYFKLPLESAATDWAGNYIRTHADEVNELWHDLTAAIQSFYKLLNLPDEENF